MTDENSSAGETTDQLDTGLEQQSQAAVTGTEEATVQEGGEAHQEEQSQKTPEWVQRRFNEMTRARHEAERKAEEAIHRATTAEQLARSMQSPDSAGNQQQHQQPYQAPAQNDDARIQQAAQRLNEEQTFNARSNAVYSQGKAEYPDFDEALKTIGMLGAPQNFFKDIVGLEDSHKVLHALGSNPEEAERIFSLPPLQQGRELERLAQKTSKVAPKKPVSNAPDPISNRVDGTGSKAIDLDKSSIDDFMKARNSQSRRK